MILLNLPTRITNTLRLPGSFSEKGIRLFILLSMIGNVLIILRSYQFFEYIFPTDFPQAALVLKALLASWLIVSVVLLFKNRLILLSILQLILSSFLLRCYLTFGIFEITHLCVSWALVFSVAILHYKQKAPGGEAYKTSVLGLFSSLVFFGLVFLHAGIDKLLDPAWQNGIGFRNFVEVEWILSPRFREFFLAHDVILVFANYFAILSECLFLPLLWIRRLRPVAFVLYFILAFQLFFPFNIFFIGYLALVFVIPVFLISFNRSEPLQYGPGKSLLTVWLILLVVTAGFFVSMNRWVNNQIAKRSGVQAMHFKRSHTLLKYDIQSLKVKHSSVVMDLWDILKLYEYKDPYKFLNNRVLRNGPVALFSSSHTVGTFGYRLQFQKSNGDWEEPVIFFDQDGSRGMFDRQYFMLNIFQTSMYPVTDLVYQMDYQNDAQIRSSVMRLYNLVLAPLIEVSTNRASKSSTYRTAVLSVLPLGKDCKDPKAIKWTHFIEIDFGSGVLTAHNLDTDSCYQGRHAQLENYYQRSFQ